MTTTLEGVEWSAARPGRTLPPGKAWYPLYRRLGGPLTIVPCRILRLKDVLDKRCRENQHSHFMFNKFPLPPPNHTFYKIMWEKYGTARHATDNIIRCMQFACRTTYAILQTHAQNVYQLFLFNGNNGYANAPLCYIIRTLPVLFVSQLKFDYTPSNFIACLSK